MKVNFPFSNISTVDSVVTASLAVSTLFLSASVTTASQALFPRGPQGASGSSVTVNGTEGPPGGFGLPGADGLNALLLSSSRAKCAGECYTVINATAGSVLVDWTDLNGVSRNDNLGAYDTAYICSRTSPATTATVIDCDNPCDELVTTITEAQNIPCDC